MSFQTIRQLLAEEGNVLINQLADVFLLELETEVKRRMEYMKQSHTYLRRLEEELYKKHEIVYKSDLMDSPKKYKQQAELLMFSDIYKNVDYAIYIELLILDDFCQRTEDALYNIHYNILQIKEKWAITPPQVS